MKRILQIFAFAAFGLVPIGANAADRMITPTEQTAPPATIAAPVNARAPEEIDVDDLQPSLFRPMVQMLKAIQESQKEAIERLTLLQKEGGGGDERADEILAALKKINGKEVIIKGWDEQVKSLTGLRDVLEKFRERLERVATVDDLGELATRSDLEEALEAFPIPEPAPEVDLTGVAREETLLAWGERFPTVENIREISANVASLTERLDELAAEVQEIDLTGETASLKKKLTLLNLLVLVVLAVLLVQAVLFLWRWCAAATTKAKERAVQARNREIAAGIEAYIAAQKDSRASARRGSNDQ